MALAPAARRGVYALAVLVGYVLSPLSWWNDAVVNIPMSLLLGGAIHRLLGLPLDISVAAAYTATNIAGVALLAIGGSGLLGASKRNMAMALAASIVYSLVVLALL